ncbi:SDR family oxidoreductase [Eudoraea chungangensis]|uniref:SDR family oxidoreductase n=1 Tax=Eudoraea chungangensis TaxID=1481905 RepID=UPI0023ECBEB1|nr:SDR family oxidoreductase [Eudoraea chungangensis]
MEISLHNRNALVGGSSRGIGKAIALQLAKSGAKVTLMARSKEGLENVLHELAEFGEQPHDYLLVDFNNYESFGNTLKDYFSKNKVDILVNNTQGPPSGNSLEVSPSDYQKAFDLLFKTVVLTTELALEHMKSNKWGRIINVASVSVKEPLSYLALSNTIRAAVVTWAKSLATDIAPHGITVNSILTGYFNTERIAQLTQKKAEQLGIKTEEVRETMKQNVPMQRIGNPEEYAYLVTFLASDKAAYITGSNIPIDGGLLKSL